MAATQGEGEEVIELNLRFICPEDARIVSKFITCHGISLPTILDSPRRCSACLFLSELLILLKRNSILGILDDNKKLSFLNFLTQELRKGYGAGGPWFDGMETLMVDSHRLMKRSDRMLRKLMKQIKKMKTNRRFLYKLMKQMKMGSFSSIYVKKHHKSVKARLANIKKKMKSVASDRNSLDFYYPV